MIADRSDQMRQVDQMILPQGFDIVLFDMQGNLHIKYVVKIDQFKYTVGRSVPLGNRRLGKIFRDMMASAMKQHIERVMGDG